MAVWNPVRAPIMKIVAGLILLVLLAACGGTGPQTQQPQKPGDFNLTALAAFCIDQDGAGVRLQWSGAEGAEQYLVLRGGTELGSLGASARSYSDTEGVNAGDTLQYQLRAVNSGGHTHSDTVEFTVPADLCDTDSTEPPAPPAPVTDLAAEFECNPVAGVRLTWSAVEGASAYELERDHFVLSELAADAVAYLDAAVRAGGSYTYVLHAVNDVGLTLSAPVTVSIPFADCGLVGPTVSVGDYHSLAIAHDGTVWAWGENGDGQLGAGHYDPLLAPVTVIGLERAVAVAAGRYHSLALDDNGQVWAWGDNDEGQLGLSTSNSTAAQPVELPASIIGIAAGADHSLAVTADGFVWAWGRNGSGQAARDPLRFDEVMEPHQLQGLSDVVRVIAQQHSSFALHSDGTVSAWGSNDFGVLGVGDAVPSHLPRKITGLANVTQVAAGDEHALALTADGSVYVWGEASLLGLGAAAASELVPVLLPSLTGVVWISASEARSLAVTDAGQVLVWGDVTQEEGESAAVSWRFEPTPVPGLVDAAAVFAGEMHTLAMRQDGSLLAWGFNDVRQLGSALPERYHEFVRPQIDADVVAAASGSVSSLALLDDGTVLTWGSGYTGVAAAGLGGRVPLPTPLPTLARIDAIDVGNAFSLALDKDGTVWSWGHGLYGRLGHGDSANRSEPQAITTLPRIQSISAGRGHALAIDEDGLVWAWGIGGSGQLGNGADDDQSTPVQVINLPARAVAVSAGERHSLALLANGTVWAWGENYDGQLGQDTFNAGLNTPVPVAMTGAPVISVEASAINSYALLNDGTVLAWGANWYGQLGNGTDYGTVGIPTLVPDLTGIASISTSYETVLAVTSDGTALGWGANWYGQLGVSYPDVELAPVKLDVPGAVSWLDAGREVSFLVVDGVLYVAGDDSGLLTGMGQLVHSSAPLPVLAEVTLAGP